MKGIYKITNLINNKVYIGQSCNINDRKRVHFYTLDKNVHSNELLQKSYNKYGKNNFIFEKIEETENLNERELYYINEYGGVNSELNYNLKNPLTNEWGEYIRVKQKKLMSGVNNPNYGNKWSKKQRESLSKQKLGVKLEDRIGKEKSDLIKQKMSKSRTGKKHSNEVKEKIRQANLGDKNPAYGKGDRQRGDKNPIWGKPCKTRKPISQYTKDGVLVKKYDYIYQVKEDGFGPSNVMYCAMGKKGYNTSGGFLWKFKN